MKLNRKWRLTGLAGMLIFGMGCSEQMVGGKFEANPESLKQYRCPDWFRDAKLGIYVHWWVYSVAERGEWYARNM